MWRPVAGEGVVVREIDADYARLFFGDERIVVVETKEGVVVEGVMVKKALELIERHLGAGFVAIIDRRHHYKLMRLEIYGEVNACDSLLGLAIVTHSTAADMLTDLEIPLSRKPIAKFRSLEEAMDWARALIGCCTQPQCAVALSAGES